MSGETMQQTVDLRSDTVTRPCAAMRDAMRNAEVGDDVFGDDPTVLRLQRDAADLFGFEDALLFPSGTQSNLAALMAHCQRGDEVILGHGSHTYRYEAGGAAVLGSIQPQAVPNAPDGSLDLDAVESAIKPDDPHFARSRLLALENTIGGRVLARAYQHEAIALARRHGLAVHLDGARICNAAVSLGVTPKAMCEGFDSVSVCLSKGLGAPAGTLLFGRRAFIASAYRARKILGGAMRQAGILAAAGLYALEHNVQRLATDHANAERLAEGLRALGYELEQQTNMVFVDVGRERAAALGEHLAQSGITVVPGARMRLVTHLDVDADGIDRAVEAFGAFSG